MKKLTVFLAALVFAFILGTSAQAQTVGDATFVVSESKLSTINLPGGARQVKNENIPQGVKDTFAKLFAAGDGRVKQGDSEVIVWAGNYKKSGGDQMIQQLEKSLKDSGWEYEVGAKDKDFVLFSLLRNAPQKRAIVGFFVPTEDAFVLCLTEMLPNETPVAENQKPQ